MMMTGHLTWNPPSLSCINTDKWVDYLISLIVTSHTFRVIDHHHWRSHKGSDAHDDKKSNNHCY